MSYFTFAAMSYTIDVYKRRCRVETNLLHYALFVSFFPTLINGPIERYPQMRPQIQKSRRFSYGRCAGGAFRMLWGYTKKMVLADNLSHYVSLVYGDVGSMSGPEPRGRHGAVCRAAVHGLFRLLRHCPGRGAHSGL